MDMCRLHRPITNENWEYSQQNGKKNEGFKPKQTGENTLVFSYSSS